LSETRLVTHVFVPDGTNWLDRIRRCGYVVGGHDSWCQLPETNRVHQVPDVTERQDEHRRRAGEGDIA
jgi:hypothetical protein